MEAIGTVLQWLQQVAYLAVGVWAAVHWRRRGDGPSRWLALTFLALGTTVFVGVLQEQLGAVPAVVADVSGVTLVAFPYLLLRFADSFEPMSRWLRGGVATGVLLVVASIPFLPDLEPGDPRPPLVQLVLLLVLATWLTALPTVARRFWRASRDQPNVVRSRLRLLSVATVALAVALVFALAPQAETTALTIVVQLLAVTSSWLFLLGFAPPGVLRVRWRQPEERRAHDAAVALMGARTPEEVATLLVPHIRSLVAARGVELHHAGELRATAGTTDVPSADDITVPLVDGRLRIVPDTYTPFFGPDEYALLDRLAVLTDLALDRTALLASERRFRAELESANAELESFLYTASHDLKSPLIALLSYVDVLTTEHGEELGDEGRWYLERMASNCRYMESLVGDLLELSRVGRVETAPDRVELAEVLADVTAEVHHRFPAVRVDVDELPTLWVNELRARQLFRNLVENAATHAGDDVTVTVSAQRADDDLLLLVRDDGPGIPEAYRERVFGVFERLDGGPAKTGGNGIGLAICRKIVESLGGSIDVTDRTDGAEFAILLPADVEYRATEHQQAPSPSPARRLEQTR